MCSTDAAGSVTARDVDGPLRVTRYRQLAGSSLPKTVHDPQAINRTRPPLTAITWSDSPDRQSARPTASSTEGVTAASAPPEGETVAEAKPLPHHRLATSIAPSAPPSPAPTLAATRRAITVSVNDSRISGLGGCVRPSSITTRPVADATGFPRRTVSTQEMQQGLRLEGKRIESPGRLPRFWFP